MWRRFLKSIGLDVVRYLNVRFLYFEEFLKYCDIMTLMFAGCRTYGTNIKATLLALQFTRFSRVRCAFWINQGGSTMQKWNYFVVFVLIWDVNSYAWLTEVDMTNVTVVLYYVGLTNGTSDDFLTRIHLNYNPRKVLLICGVIKHISR